MFHARINKIKIFDNREGFLGLFNRTAEIKVYGFAGKPESVLRLQNLSEAMSGASSDKQQEEVQKKLLSAIDAEAKNLRVVQHLPIKEVKDNQTLTFGDAGIELYSSAEIPETFGMSVWVVELDDDIRDWTLSTSEILESKEFNTLTVATMAALAVTAPLATASIALGKLVLDLILKKQSANKNDLIGYWHTTLNRKEHYLHGKRDCEDVLDVTKNMMIDYTLFADGEKAAVVGG